MYFLTKSSRAQIENLKRRKSLSLFVCFTSAAMPGWHQTSQTLFCDNLYYIFSSFMLQIFFLFSLEHSLRKKIALLSSDTSRIPATYDFFFASHTKSLSLFLALNPILNFYFFFCSCCYFPLLIRYI